MVGERFDPGPTDERRLNCDANTATEEQSSDSSKEVSKFNAVLGLVASVLRNWLLGQRSQRFSSLYLAHHAKGACCAIIKMREQHGVAAA